MLALTDEALARIVRKARTVPHRKRRKWLKRVADKLDPKYSRQRRYRELKRNGMKCVTVRADPTTLHDLLEECGIYCLNAERETLGAGLERLVSEWERGQLRVVKARESDLI